jgi:hypothetical protein
MRKRCAAFLGALAGNVSSRLSFCQDGAFSARSELSAKAPSCPGNLAGYFFRRRKSMFDNG